MFFLDRVPSLPDFPWVEFHVLGPEQLVLPVEPQPLPTERGTIPHQFREVLELKEPAESSCYKRAEFRCKRDVQLRPELVQSR